MIRFECDYATGAHPQVMDKLMETNLEECPGYGVDPHCARAAELLKELCQAPNADVHFLVGGTQTNMTVIAAALRVISQLAKINTSTLSAKSIESVLRVNGIISPVAHHSVAPNYRHVLTISFSHLKNEVFDTCLPIRKRN